MSKFGTANVRLFELDKLYWIEWEIATAIEAFGKFIEGNERVLEKILQQHKEEIEADDFLNSEESEELKAEYRMQLHHENRSNIEELKGIQRDSVFLMGYAFFESKLREICLILEKITDNSIKVGDKWGVEEYCQYLTQVIQIDSKKINGYYGQLKKLKGLRDKIAHAGSIMNETKKKEMTLTIPGITAVDDRILINDLVFFEHFFKNLKKFWDELIIALDDRYRELKKGHAK